MKEEYPYKECGDRIKKLREDNLYTQQQFSALLGISLRSYQRYEQGVRLPDSKILSKLSSITLVSTDWILSGNDSKKLPSQEGDFYEMIDKIDYIYMNSSQHLIDFIDKILNIAIAIAKDENIEKSNSSDLLELLFKISELSSQNVQDAFHNITAHLYNTKSKDGRIIRVFDRRTLQHLKNDKKN